jgi:hypothetical protein
MVNRARPSSELLDEQNKRLGLAVQDRRVKQEAARNVERVSDRARTQDRQRTEDRRVTRRTAPTDSFGTRSPSFAAQKTRFFTIPERENYGHSPRCSRWHSGQSAGGSVMVG